MCIPGHRHRFVHRRCDRLHVRQDASNDGFCEPEIRLPLSAGFASPRRLVMVRLDGTRECTSDGAHIRNGAVSVFAGGLLALQLSCYEGSIIEWFNPS